MNHKALRLPLPSTVSAVVVARDTVTSTLRDWGFRDHDWLDGVALIVTELVSNALRHADGAAVLEMRADGQVTVAVTDPSPIHARLREPDEHGGRGLLIVDALCTRWGVHDLGVGKQVWAELPPHPHHTPAHEPPADRDLREA